MLPQAFVTNLASELAARATAQQLSDAIATQEPTIADGGLPQAKVSGLISDLSARATSVALTSGLASKQDVIADGGLSQAKVSGLVADLSAKASVSALSTVNTNLVAALVTSQTSLEAQLDEKASTEDLLAAVQTRQATITEGSFFDVRG